MIEASLLFSYRPPAEVSLLGLRRGVAELKRDRRISDSPFVNFTSLFIRVVRTPSAPIEEEVGNLFPSDFGLFIPLVLRRSNRFRLRGRRVRIAATRCTSDPITPLILNIHSAAL